MINKIFEKLNNYWLTEDYEDNFGFGLNIVPSKYSGVNYDIYIYQDYMHDKQEYSPFVFIIHNKIAYPVIIKTKEYIIKGISKKNINKLLSWVELNKMQLLKYWGNIKYSQKFFKEIKYLTNETLI